MTTVEQRPAPDRRGCERARRRVRPDVRRTKRDLQVFGAQTRLFGDAGEHLRTEFLVIVERKDEVGPLEVSQGPVRTALAFDVPSDPSQRREDTTRLRRWPVAHAA